MSDMDFICPTCKRPTHPTNNEIIEYLAKEIDRYNDVLFERTKELDRTQKELEQSEICCTEWEKQALDYKAENIALSGDLERTRTALEIAVDAIDKGEAALIGCQEADDKYISDVTAEDGLELLSKAYKQITALEQKE